MGMASHPRAQALWQAVRGADLRVIFSDHEYVETMRELEPPPDAINFDSDPHLLLRPEGEWDRPGVLDRSRQRPATNPH